MSRDSLTPCYFARPISAVELATALQLRVPKGAIKDSQDSKFQPIPFSEQKVLTQSVDSCATVSVVQENRVDISFPSFCHYTATASRPYDTDVLVGYLGAKF